MYESFLPDFNAASNFYKRNAGESLIDLFFQNAESYFSFMDVEYTLEKDSDSLKINTPRVLFVLTSRNGVPSVVSVYAIANSFIRKFRDSIWTTKKVFGFPVGAVMDDADDGYFETHPSKFKVIIFPKMQ